MIFYPARNNQENNPIGPVVVGGVSGSGTRVTAKLAMTLGVYMGLYTNKVYDYKWFGSLLNRPRWVRECATEEDIKTAFQILRKTLTGPFIPNTRMLRFFFSALRHRQEAINWQDKKMRNVTAASEIEGPVELDYDEKKRASLWDGARIALGTMFAPKASVHTHTGWGWKAPQSYIFLSTLANSFAEPKYIHVMRHGLDMACSSNQRDLFNWGWRYGISFESSLASIRRNSLKYWCCANEEVFDIGKRMGEEAFLPLKFEEVVTNPGDAYTRVAEFLGIPWTTESLQSFKQYVQAPSSLNRYQQEDLSIFDEEDLERVQKFGYTV